MKFNIGLWVLFMICLGCSTQKSTTQKKSDFKTDTFNISAKEKHAFSGKNATNDTVTIADDETEYQIIIIDPGYYSWLHSIAMPQGYYSEHYMKARNQIYVSNWNQRVLNPTAYDPSLYEMRINYDPTIDYGYEVNYKLYNYFIYFQRKYRQRLGPFFPGIR